ncbi:MAG: hypothetical protein MUF38_05765 [Anaerolineae bacterium]|jgi:hypothetical protein|nr:hypothetical protein [Anaerolineae bacterium]
MSDNDKQPIAIVLTPGVVLMLDPEIWDVENSLTLGKLGDDVRLQINLQINDILAETTQRVDGVVILRKA